MAKTIVAKLRERMETARKGMEANLDALARISAEARVAHGEAAKHLATARKAAEKRPSEGTVAERTLWERAEAGLYATASLGPQMQKAYRDAMTP